MDSSDDNAVATEEGMSSFYSYVCLVIEKHGGGSALVLPTRFMRIYNTQSTYCMLLKDYLFIIYSVTRKSFSFCNMTNIGWEFFLVAGVI